MLRQSNVEFIHLERVEDLSALPVCDFFYSLLVLQHNPPPIMAHVLNVALGRLSPGGLCLFQLDTYCENYRFEVGAYLASPQAGMEMHMLPQPYVHAILRRNDIELIEMFEIEPNKAHAQSKMFFGRSHRKSASMRPTSHGRPPASE